ncbi:MAG: peroxidase-related enzyme [Balneolaceae bacterium]|nr:peroxidase-related enzyme [Balneolaceae bacterium]
MPFIELNNQLPGITGLLEQYEETAKPLRELAETLLRGESPLTAGERELIAALVSERNECIFCSYSHGAAAGHLLEEGKELVRQVREDFRTAPVSDKLKALLNIAAQVQLGGKEVREEDIEVARSLGATDREIHDTVLIAAAFCMYNRYVDGLGTYAPPEEVMYDRPGRELADKGYVRNN